MGFDIVVTVAVLIYAGRVVFAGEKRRKELFAKERILFFVRKNSQRRYSSFIMTHILIFAIGIIFLLFQILIIRILYPVIKF